MKIVYDPNADAMNITFREGKISQTVEIAPEIHLDLDAKSRPLFMEIIGAKEKLGKGGTEEFLMKNLALRSDVKPA